VAEDGLELPLENGAFSFSQFEPGQTGDMVDINVLGGHRGRNGEERPGGGKGKDEHRTLNAEHRMPNER